MWSQDTPEAWEMLPLPLVAACSPSSAGPRLPFPSGWTSEVAGRDCVCHPQDRDGQEASFPQEAFWCPRVPQTHDHSTHPASTGQEGTAQADPP